MAMFLFYCYIGYPGQTVYRQIDRDSVYISFFFNYFNHDSCLNFLLFDLNSIEWHHEGKKTKLNSFFSEMQPICISEGRKFHWGQCWVSIACMFA